MITESAVKSTCNRPKVLEYAPESCATACRCESSARYTDSIVELKWHVATSQGLGALLLGKQCCPEYPGWGIPCIPSVEKQRGPNFTN